uniref:uncharacterized protein LOC131101618 isoform X1 n=1 Tax=Doryrhamphus excisus TaxID=161450 RepID=UPI0025AE3376|nr:uncharacterized protein LOC131101618 isoform X1 [Doryrhamphus excisus]
MAPSSGLYCQGIAVRPLERRRKYTGAYAVSERVHWEGKCRYPGFPDKTMDVADVEKPPTPPQPRAPRGRLLQLEVETCPGQNVLQPQDLVEPSPSVRGGGGPGRGEHRAGSRSHQLDTWGAQSATGRRFAGVERTLLSAMWHVWSVVCSKEDRPYSCCICGLIAGILNFQFVRALSKRPDSMQSIHLAAMTLACLGISSCTLSTWLTCRLASSEQQRMFLEREHSLHHSHEMSEKDVLDNSSSGVPQISYNGHASASP